MLQNKLPVSIIGSYSNYVLGTQKNHILKKTISLGTNPKINIKRKEYDDVAKTINHNLRKFDMLEFYDKITIDTNAIVEIKRTNTNHNKFKKVSFEDFILYPFSNYCGILFLYEVLDESNDFLVCKASAIDPVNDYKMFIKSN